VWSFGQAGQTQTHCQPPLTILGQTGKSLTVLVGATTNGQQVQDADGLWHDVPCDRDSIAVNIGDMLEMATQGHFKSTLHRVINPENTSRLSIPLFLHPRPEVFLTNTCRAGDFLRQRLLAIGVL